MTGRKSAFRTRRILGPLLAVVILLAACAQRGGDSSEEAGGGGTGEKQEVTLLLSFLHGVLNSHYYLAEDLGYFDQCGFDVELLPALEIDNPLSVLLAGRVDYAVIDPLQAVSAAYQGLPAAVIQADLASTPMSYVSLAEVGIEEPADLPGHVVGTVPGGDSEWFLQVIMEDLPAEERERVQLVKIGFDIKPILSGKVDAQSVFPTDPTYATMKVEGTDFNIFAAKDYGINTHGNVLVTSEKTLEEDPDSVTRFLAAISAGLEASLDPANAERAVELTQEKVSQEGVQDVLSTDVGLFLYDLIDEFRSDPEWDENGVGWNKEEAWAQAQDILVQFGQIPEGDELPVEELYTNEVLEKVFADGPEVDLDKVCPTS